MHPAGCDGGSAVVWEASACGGEATRASVSVSPAVQTRTWLVCQADRLVRTRKLLEAELAKFIHVEPVRERYARGCIDPADCTVRPLNPFDPKFSSRGNICLRRLVEEACLLPHPPPSPSPR